MSRPPLPVDRFLLKCVRDPVSGCLIFGDRPDVYGKQWVAGKCVRLHRLALELHVATKLGLPGRFTLPAGAVVRHLPGCTSKACCEPAHLAAGTYSDNNRDTLAAGRTRKLKPADVLVIRDAPRTTDSRRELADALGVTWRHVREIQIGRRAWAWYMPQAEMAAV